MYTKVPTISTGTIDTCIHAWVATAFYCTFEPKAKYLEGIPLLGGHIFILLLDVIHGVQLGYYGWASGSAEIFSWEASTRTSSAFATPRVRPA